MARRRPPPPTASQSRPLSKAKDYTTHRKYAVQDELDELRNRGVAKFMNHHFTESSKKLAQEKAEADAALADLERRRAQTSEFVPTNGGDLNPFDAMYVELQQKRSDCRRKEKETMLLYQRYKQKFKKTKVSTPSKTTPLESQSTPPVKEEETYYDEEEEEDHQEIMQTPQKEAPELSPESPDETTPLVAAPPPSTSPSRRTQDPPGVPPSPVRDWNDTMVSSPDVLETFVASPPKISKNSNVSLVIDCDESVSVAAVSSTTVVDVASAAAAKENGQVLKQESAVLSPSESFSENRPTAEVTADIPAPATDEDSDEDERSVISGLTTVNSVVTRKVMEQLESEMEFFIQNETKAIQKLLDAEEENWQQRFGSSSLGPDSDSSVACDHSVRASLKAEQMAEEMQKMLDQFGKEELSTASESQSDTKVGPQPSPIKSSMYPRKFKSPNPSEEWMVHWDEKFEREYFHETKTNKTQWEAPVMKLGFTDNSDVTPMKMPQRTTKLIVSKRLSRSNLYRKKIRKQRFRRAFCLLVVLGSALLSAVHWQLHHSEKSYSEAMEATYVSLKDTYEYSFTNRTTEEQEGFEVALRLEREKKGRENAERKRKADEVDRKRQEVLVAQRAREETEQKRKAEKEAEGKRQLAAKEKAQVEAAERRQEEQQRLQRLEQDRKEEEERLEVERMAKEKDSLRRPWGCNLPFAPFAHGRCRRLAKINPIYSEQNLLNSFLQ
jgi:hypothetical protein